MVEVADEAYIKHCFNCGGKIIEPVLYHGYVFCSEKCKNEFISSKNHKKA
jgi:predicted nucleic acid-binding Zn ribbon protein